MGIHSITASLGVWSRAVAVIAYVACDGCAVSKDGKEHQEPSGSATPDGSVRDAPTFDPDVSRKPDEGIADGVSGTETASPDVFSDGSSRDGGLDGAVQDVSARDGALDSGADTSLEADTAGLLDVATDTALDDGGRDANDGGSVSEDASPRFCETLSPAPKFCRDFDNVAAYKTGWSSTYFNPQNPPGVVLALYSDDTKSPPYCLSAKALSLLADDVVQAMVVQDLGPVPSEIRFAFDLKNIKRDTAGASNLERIQIGTYPNDWALGLLLDRKVAYIEEAIPDMAGNHTWVRHKMAAVPGDSGWTRVEMRANIRTSLLTVLLDGVVTVEDASITPMRTGNTRIIAGINYQTGALSETEFLVDNITVDMIGR